MNGVQSTLLVSVLLSAVSSRAEVTVYAQDLAGFNAAAGTPPVAIDFDSIPSGSDIGGQTIRGAQFIQTGAPLIVVAGTNTITPEDIFYGAPNPESNKLYATTGAHVLSPGGEILGPGYDPAVENDDLTVVFDPPVAAIGFDYLSQSADGSSYAGITVLGINNEELYTGSIPISNLGLGGAGTNDFWGILSTSRNIARIVIHEADENAEYPDCNIGYDSFRFHWFSITGISMTDSSQPVLKWVDAGNLATYCVESRASLNEGAWSPVAPTSQWPVTGQSWTNTAVTNKSKCFYRVNVVGE